MSLSSFEEILMNSSDATPDNSPPNSPASLPPPKGIRQTSARPRKPQAPKEATVKVQAPKEAAVKFQAPKGAALKFQASRDVVVRDKAPAVTKPRSAISAQPRTRLPKKEKPVVENDFPVRPLVEQPFVEEPPVEKLPAEKTLVVKFPKKAKERAPKVERSVVEKPLIERAPKVERPLVENPLVFKLPKKSKEKTPKAPSVAPKLPKQVKRKEAPVPRESTDSDQEPDFSLLEQERRIALQSATRRLEKIIEETTILADDLQKENDEVLRLQEEKERLLDELLVWEGLVDSSYPPLNSMALLRKPKKARR